MLFLNNSSKDKDYYDFTMAVDAEQLKKQINKRDKIIKIYAEWIEHHSKGESIYDYLQVKKYKNVLIYGMGCLGKSVYQELVASGCDIKAIVDRNSKGIDYGYMCKKTLDEVENIILESVDVVIVTAIDAKDYVGNILNKREEFRGKIISLEELLSEI